MDTMETKEKNTSNLLRNLVILLLAISGALVIYFKNPMQISTAEKKEVAKTFTMGKVLDMSNKGITSLPAEIRHNTAVVEFNVSNNKLTGIPAEIRYMERLEKFDASNNQITDLPAELGYVKNLKYLDLSNNKVTEIPNEFYYLENLEELNFSGNPIKPDHLARLKNKFGDVLIID